MCQWLLSSLRLVAFEWILRSWRKLVEEFTCVMLALSVADIVQILACMFHMIDIKIADMCSARDFSWVVKIRNVLTLG